MPKDKSEKTRQPPDTPAVIGDDNTLLRNGVLMKSFFKPSDRVDRSYGWVKAPEVLPPRPSASPVIGNYGISREAPVRII